jgi:small subunit ribosomal protein S17
MAETETEATETEATQTGTGTPSATAAPSAKSAETAEADAATATATRAARKVREGVVVSDKMDKTVTVAVIERVRHPKYAKFVMQTKKLYAHDEANDAHAGDRVRIMETRPLSKQKRWRVVEVLERAK